MTRVRYEADYCKDEMCIIPSYDMWWTMYKRDASNKMKRVEAHSRFGLLACRALKVNSTMWITIKTSWYPTLTHLMTCAEYSVTNLWIFHATKNWTNHYMCFNDIYCLHPSLSGKSTNSNPEFYIRVYNLINSLNIDKRIKIRY